MRLEEALARASNPHGRGCKIATILSDLDQLDSDALVLALESPALSSGVIKAALREIGVEVSDSTIQRHRGGKCSCR